ncbi:adenylosuccinate lyase (plasmid) [Ensifer sp. WSM1721]
MLFDARFNATQISAIHQALVHAQERSGSAWTLEWLILPQMVDATAAALRLAAELAGNIRRWALRKLSSTSWCLSRSDRSGAD